MIQINILDTTVSVSAKLSACSVTFPNDKSGLLHNRFTILVKNGTTKKSFHFYNSNQAWRDGKQELTESDLQQAYQCFLSDSMAGDQSFEDFCSDMGYDTDSRNAERIHKACIKSFEKYEALNLPDIYDYYNAFKEVYNI